MITSTFRFPGDPFGDFDDWQRQFERLFGLRSGLSGIREVARGSFPAVNIGSTPEAVEVFAFAPGIDAATLEVSVDKGLLTIAGERREAAGRGPEPGAAAAERNGQNGAAAQATVYASERPLGSFRRVIALPEDADPNRVDATYRNGVLKVRVEKRESSRPRRITVNEAR